MKRSQLFQFSKLRTRLAGELYFDDTIGDETIRRVYATDASVYQEIPLAVALPKSVADIQKLIQFADNQELSLIPRAAGTSLAGQVVGNGIVVDVSKYMTGILQINATEKWVRVQPGVIRDDLNKILRPLGLLFGPETSTANRAMIGGMIGNNSCGLHSITWGSVRDNIREVKALLADGKEVIFKSLTRNHFTEKAKSAEIGEREKAIYAGMMGIFSNPVDEALVRKNFPKASITRRNSGYALDTFFSANPESDLPETINLSQLIAGSEGTLCFITEAKLALVELPPDHTGVICINCRSLSEALEANRLAMRHAPKASELVDKYIMDFTKDHPEFSKHRGFIRGDPAALLIVEFWGNTAEELNLKLQALIASLTEASIGYAYSILLGNEASHAWDIRKAGLGLIRNLPGDEQPHNLIEDCAVDVDDLPHYIADLEMLLRKHGLKASFYAHAGAGELHVEPIINLKTANGRRIFRELLGETAALVKKYDGTLSGEHGDGRLRGEFIPFMMGQEVYELFKQVKKIWDPKGIFNPGKIVDTPPMDSFLRFTDLPAHDVFKPVMQFGEGGIARMAEKCSGSGDCRKSALSGGTMCPSYMATRREYDTTRARANILRQYLTQGGAKAANEEMVKDVLDLCLSCKGCKAECPSQVDVGKMKAEFVQAYMERHGTPKRTRLIADYATQMRRAAAFPKVFNALMSNKILRKMTNNLIGFHPDRSIPKLYETTLRKWWKKHQKTSTKPSLRKVHLFCDEFTNYNDVEVGMKAILLLETLGYQVIIPEHGESGRARMSKGLLKEAKGIAAENVRKLTQIVTAEAPLIGIEPSAILSFRDEYPDLVPPELKEAALGLKRHSFLFEEFILKESEAGRIGPRDFSDEPKELVIHGHCHQKALSSAAIIEQTLTIPVNYHASVLASGCCGMAGSFGYEKEHFDLSMKIGELVVFPAVREAAEDTLIAASGTSCRHQIWDGTGKKSYHSAEILYDALVKK